METGADRLTAVGWEKLAIFFPIGYHAVDTGRDERQGWALDLSECLVNLNPIAKLSQRHPDRSQFVLYGKHMKSTWQVLSWAVVLLAFVAVGFLFGWLIGVSNSPVVASAIPLVFGLAGGFSFRYLERRAAEDSYAKKLKSATDDAETQEKIATSLGLDQRVEWMPAFWSTAIMAFCVSTYFGVLSGVTSRIGPQQSLSVILTMADIKPDSVVGEDRIAFQNALFRLRAIGATDEEVEDIFKHALCPLLKQKFDDEYGNDLSSTVAELFEGMETKIRGGRGPASVLD